MSIKITAALRCPPIRVLRSVAFNETLARKVVDLELPGDGTLDWVLTQIYDNFDGKIIDYDGMEIDVQNRFIDEDFSHTDTRRRVNAYKQRATRKFRQRLHVSMLERVMWMWFAFEIDRRLKEL